MSDEPETTETAQEKKLEKVIQTENQALDDNLREIEFTQLVQSLQEVQKSKLQFGIFVGTISLTALSLSFSSQKAGPTIFIGLLLWMFMYVDVVLTGQAFGIYFRLKEAYNYTPAYLLLYLPSSFQGGKFDEIAALSNEFGQAKALRQLRYRMRSKLGFWFPLAGSILVIGVGLILWSVAGWPLF